MVTADNDRSPLLQLSVLGVGLLGLIHDSWAAPAAASRIGFHTLFGVLLWVSVVALFYRRVRRAHCLLPIDIRVFSRHLSRLVYLLLYVLMFCSLIIGILRAAPQDFRSYLASGCVALVTIQALAALCHRFAIRGVVTRTTS
jgi:cytochrome b561